MDSKLATKVYALTSSLHDDKDIDLVSLFTMTNGKNNMTCKLRTRSSVRNMVVEVYGDEFADKHDLIPDVLSSKRENNSVDYHMSNLEIVSTTGYLFVTLKDKLFVFNTTRAGISGPVFLFFEPLESMIRLVTEVQGASPQVRESLNLPFPSVHDDTTFPFQTTTSSVMDCSVERHLVLAINQRMVEKSRINRSQSQKSMLFVYDVQLPLYAQPIFNPRTYTQPIMMLAILVIGLYQFLNQRRRNDHSHILEQLKDMPYSINDSNSPYFPGMGSNGNEDINLSNYEFDMETS